MSISEFSPESFEYPHSKWTEFDAYIRGCIKKTASAIEYADPEVAKTRLDALNNEFRSDSCMGLYAKIEPDLPLFVAVGIDENGVGDMPVIDAELMGQIEYHGIFQGCVIEKVEGDDANHLFYEMDIYKEGYEKLRLRVSVDDAAPAVQYPESDTWDDKARKAFAVLENSKDNEFQSMVQALQQAYWDDDQPAAHRQQFMGMILIDMLAHPAYLEMPEAPQKLKDIIFLSLDEEFLYTVEGFSIVEVREPDGTTHVEVKNKPRQHALKPVGVHFVQNFEIIQVHGEAVEVAPTDTLQPVMSFFDVNRSEVVHYPLRYIFHVDEFDYDDAPSTYEVKQPYYGAMGTKTCGELSNEYYKRNPLR